MQEEELIKQFLKSIGFSTHKAYIDLINKYVLFKEQYLKAQTKERALKPKEAKK